MYDPYDNDDNVRFRKTRGLMDFSSFEGNVVILIGTNRRTSRDLRRIDALEAALCSDGCDGLVITVSSNDAPTHTRDYNLAVASQVGFEALGTMIHQFTAASNVALIIDPAEVGRRCYADRFGDSWINQANVLVPDSRFQVFLPENTGSREMQTMLENDVKEREQRSSATSSLPTITATWMSVEDSWKLHPLVKSDPLRVVCGRPFVLF